MLTKLLKIAIRMSKLAIYTMIICQTIVMANATETTAQHKFLREISVELESKVGERKLLDLVTEIESKSDFHFAYSKAAMRKLSVDLDGGQWNMDELMMELSKQLQLSIRRVNSTISLMPVSDDTELPAINEEFEVQLSVSGKVTDENGEGLPGATVQEKGTTNGIITDVEGNYSLGVSEGAVLIVSFVGYKSQEVSINNRSTVDIQMFQDLEQLSEVVVIGYNSEKRRDLTGAISVVDLEDVKTNPSSNPMQALQGRVPGLYIETTGKPSGEASKILVRGVNTLGNNDPLYIIDGVPTKSQSILQNMNTNSIESIQVLKDASATSIYGSRASNGVIIITTKEGGDKLKVELNSSISFQNYTWQKIDVLNTEERGRVLWQASINDGTDPIAHSALYTYDWHYDGQTAVLDKVIPTEWIGGDPADMTPSADTYWQDVIYQTGKITQTNLNISGGSKQGAASLGLNYLKNDGIMRYTDFQKMSIRLNSSYNLIDDKLRIGENLLIAASSETPEGRDLGGSNMVNLALWLQPILPIYTTNGEWAGPIGGGFSDRNNPLHMLHIHRNNKNKLKTLFGNVFAEYDIFENLTFRTSLGVDYRNGHNRTIEPTYRTGFLVRSTNTLNEHLSERINFAWSNTMNYSLSFGEQVLNFLLGTEAIKEDFYSFQAGRTEFAIQDDDYFYLGSGTGVQTNDGSSTGYRLLSYFGKIGYSLKDRYLASATLRYDGSSRFGEENKFGVFPAITLGWRISDEAFLINSGLISNLKLRTGIGRVGNQEIGNNAWYGLYATNYGAQNGLRNVGSAYDLNGSNTGTLPSGYVAIQTENANLKWETTDEVNIGVDFGFFSNMISGSFDYFSRTTRDILISPPNPAISGEGANRWLNGATVENHGFEAILNFQKSSGEFTYGLNGLIQSFNDKVVELPESVVRSYPGNIEKTIIGQSQTSVFGYVTNGIFQNQEEVDAHATQPGKDIGRIRYADLNSDGVIDPLDQTWHGTTLPDFEFGFNTSVSFKGLTLSMFLQGVSGKSVYNSEKLEITTLYSNGMNSGKEVLNAWTPQNSNSDIPALSNVNTNNENRISDYFLVNGSYVKLRNIQISYDFHPDLIEKIGIEYLNIYVLGENLGVLKDSKGKNRFFGSDPETPGLEYPRPTNITVGINLSF